MGAALGPSLSGPREGRRDGKADRGDSEGAAVGSFESGASEGRREGKADTGSRDGAALGPSLVGAEEGRRDGKADCGVLDGKTVGVRVGKALPRVRLVRLVANVASAPVTAAWLAATPTSERMKSESNMC